MAQRRLQISSGMQDIIFYPAIDMLDGQAVRLRLGKRNDVTVFGSLVELGGGLRTMAGIALRVEATRRLIKATGIAIIGFGSVSCLNDLRNLHDAGCAEAILGREICKGVFTLEETLAAAKET